MGYVELIEALILGADATVYEGPASGWICVYCRTRNFQTTPPEATDCATCGAPLRASFFGTDPEGRPYPRTWER